VILKIDDRIRNRKVENFLNFELSLRYDSFSSGFSFSAQFNPDILEHKELYCIGHYHKCTLEHEGKLLMTGYFLSQGFKSSHVSNPVAIGGCSLTGFLEDCQIPETMGLEFNNLSLRQIAQQILRPFQLSIVVDPSVQREMDKPFEKATAEPTQTIKDFLTKLAGQKNIVITHNAQGNLVFTRIKTKTTPILNYGGNGLPCPEMVLSFNGQAMHSHITVKKQASKENPNAGEVTIRNPYVPFVYRPRVITQNSGDNVDTSLAARNALSDELRNISLKFTTDRWFVDGKVIMPNTEITVLNPKAYLFKRSRWFVEQVDFKGDSKALIASVTCVLPEVYNNDTPKYLFEGINLH
jgi:prophage tail gpP-like protein